MPTSTKVKNLNINELTEAQYDAAVQGGVIGANELSVLTDVDYVEPSDLATVATTGDYSDLINRPTNLVSTNTAQTISGMKTFSGDITLSGTTSIKNNTGGTNYTMLYRDATTIHVGASTSVLKLEGSGTRPAYNNDSLALLSDVTGGLPDQTGQSGKFLTTDGTDASWSDKPLVNTATGTNALTILGSVATRDRAMNIGGGSLASDYCTVVGHGARATGAGGTCIGMSSTVNQMRSTALGSQATASGEYSLAIGWDCAASADGAIQIGGKYGVSHGNSDANTFKVGNANGNFEMMSADGTIPEARLADTTTAQQGDVLTLDANGDAVWQAGGGGSGLPDQTGQYGKFLTTDGTDASWGNSVGTILPLVGNLYELGGLTKQWSIVWARNIGYHSVPTGTGPLAVIGVNTTITLASADWSSNMQTVSVTGMTATGIVLVSPAPADQSAYTSAGILCTAQAANSLTFSCDTVPAGDLSVNIVML